MIEMQYAELIKDILDNGEVKKGRNGKTLSVFGRQLTFDLKDGFPLISGRQMFLKGIVGEMAAFVRGPKHKVDFERFGCNYWEKWCKEDGSINVDYGNAWLDFGGINQLAAVKETLASNPHDRRMIISGWNPGNLESLDLPCCHLMYQFYVRDNKHLDMLWYQRSVDTMIGLPSDFVLAAIMNMCIAADTGYKPGRITMALGDTHIYQEHIDKVEQYFDQLTEWSLKKGKMPSAELSYAYSGFENFRPEDLLIDGYKHEPAISFLLKE